MTTPLIILIIIACVVLSFFILIQKPKGGGLSGTFGSLGTQVMGVKQSGDVMEKGTWYAMATVAVLCIAVAFSMGLSKPGTQREQPNQEQQQQQQQETPASTPLQ